MSRYIDADKLTPTTHIYSDLDDNFHEKEYYRETYYTEEEIKNAPTEEVEKVIHGKWITIDIDQSGFIYTECYCSNCGWWHSNNLFTKNYCPECGAKMDGDKNEWGVNDGISCN